MLLTIVPNFTVAIRRLHDTGRSGFWYLIILLPLGGLVFLVFTVMPSDPDENRWGQPPNAGWGGPSRTEAKPSRTVTKQKGKAAHNPFAAYAAMQAFDAEPTAEEIAQRKQVVSDLYRSRVLGQANQPT